MSIWQLILAMGVPSAFTGFCFWLIERTLSKRATKEETDRIKRQAEIDEREKNRERIEMCIINSSDAALGLSIATAKAVQRIPDSKCNGDMHQALEYAEKVRAEQRDLFKTQAVRSVT